MRLGSRRCGPGRPRGKAAAGSGSLPMPPGGRPARLFVMTRVTRSRRARRAGRRARPAAATTVVGPTVRDGAIVYDELESAAELPGRLDRRPGRRDATGSSAATTRRASATRSARPPGSASSSRRACGSGRRGSERTPASRSRRSRSTAGPLAFIGVRACELAAIAIQDRVFLGGRYVDRDYAARREGVLPRRRQLPRARRDVLLRLDGHRPDVRERTATTSC